MATTSRPLANVTSQPVSEKRDRMLSAERPVLAMKCMNTGTCHTTVTAVSKRIRNTSTTRSVTTVPTARLMLVPS